jgi:hypothetical protein
MIGDGSGEMTTDRMRKSEVCDGMLQVCTYLTSSILSLIKSSEDNIDEGSQSCDES